MTPPEFPPGSAAVVEIPCPGEDYRRVLEGRERYLRRPLGRTLTAEDTRGEERQRHFILHDGGAILGGLIVVPGTGGHARLRQMWIDENHRGCGLGRRLLEGVIARLAGEGVAEFALHARVTVLPFYQTCGFRAVGPEFEEIGLPHRRMVRGPEFNRETRSPDGRR